MAELVIKTKNIIRNIEKLDEYLNPHNVSWTLVVKLLAGHRETLKQLLFHPVVQRIHSVGDSRISGLKIIKRINPDTQTMYVKPPAMDMVPSIISYADISLNSSIITIEALNKEAGRQGKNHRVVIMVELGELREGILRERIVEFYKRVFELENITIEGIGTNLGCMYGIQPTYDKLLQLSLYKQLIETKFDTNIPIISGGSSMTLPLVGKKAMPKSVNHLRVGESLFFGTTPYDCKRFRNLSMDTFEYSSNIIELEVKDTAPDGVISEGNIGLTADNSEGGHEMNYRAILDFGMLDVDVKELTPKDKKVRFAGTTSDMSVYDLGPADANHKCSYKVGDRMKFAPSYMAVARLMNSKFIDKRVV